MFASLVDTIKDHYILYYLFFVAGACMRSQSFYWMGRYGNYLAQRSKQPEGGWALSVWNKIHDPHTQEMTDLINRRGVIIVPLSFLTIGIQSVINFAVGLTAMPWLRYTLAALPGWFVWAAFYSSAGFFALKAVIAKPATVLILLLIILIAYFGVYRPYRAQRAQSTDSQE